MRAVRGPVVVGCLVLYALALVSVLPGPLFIGAGNDTGDVPEGLWAVWLAPLVGIPLVWAFAVFADRTSLDTAVRDALAEHSLGREVCWLAVCLLGFLGGSVALAWLFGLFSADFLLLAAPVMRVLFLFVVPLLFTDRAGFTVSAGRSMASLAMRIDLPAERWRWLGLVPVLLCLAVVAAVEFRAPFTPLALLIGLALAAVVVPEELFFRALLQTRLELLLGRWAGILAASVVYALTYALLGRYSAFPGPAGPLAMRGVDFALASYGILGLLYGFVWSMYRNIWLTLLLRIGVISLLVIPTMDLVG
ncbi:CAAX prenyl protease-like protein [Murinocardiopsis flavida]|uniref:CAAX prenyl protease-like protein n=1 Tax=Murinocardiopsis flavida TaxID=645275 RepID=A0A2P8DMW2_9ACTN|nr:CPBP family glutamic-type intramembrane protease [Murinocardiopsis flavida]PSK98560.1 CAAX prenyl protease-like protein [Murinocardiopsis flavida]